MTILLTGAKGYLGSVVLETTKNRHLYQSMDLGIFSNRKDNDFLCVDISKDSIYNAFRNDSIDTVVHLAGISNDPSAEISDSLTRRMNVDASKRLIDYASAAGVNRFIFISSASVYGHSDNIVTEDSPTFPQSAYAASKLEVEEYLNNHPNLNSTILRFGTLFGVSPKMRFDIAINLMTMSGIVDKELKIFGSGEQFRPFLHVADAARLICKLAESDISLNSRVVNIYDTRGIFNVASTNIRIKSLADIISERTGCRIVYESVDHPDRRDYRINSTKANAYLGFTPINNILYGVNEIYYWVKDNWEEIDIKNTTDYYTIRAWKEWIKNENTLLEA